MVVEPSRGCGGCESFVGLGDVKVLGVEDVDGEPLRPHIRCRQPKPACEGCGGVLWSHGERVVELVDLPVAGRLQRLMWHKRIWRCANPVCDVGYVSEQNAQIAPPREKLTTRAGRWVTRQAGKGRPITDLESELGCCWHTINASVQRWGEALLDADVDRTTGVSALGLDEVLMGRVGHFKVKVWSTTITDVGNGKLLDIVADKTADAPTRWILAQRQGWREQVSWATLDLSSSYRVAFDTALPHALQVADRFHVVRLANNALDQVRRRIQNETLGHRGRKGDPLYRARKQLLLASELISVNNRIKLLGLLEAGDPRGQVRNAWHAKEVLREIYGIDDPILAGHMFDQLTDDLQDPDLPFELKRLAHTLKRWRTQILNWHKSRVSNAATEAANNLIKRVKRVAFGFTNFNNYRIRALLYAGKPNLALLETLTPT